MFRILGNWANRHYGLILAVWIFGSAGLWYLAPTWDQVALDGDFDYLPDETTSRRAQALLNKAFPNEEAKSSIVLVFARENEPLTKTDRQFALETAGKLALVPDLPLVGNVLTDQTPVVGNMLASRPTADQPGGAVMVLAQLGTDMMATENVGVLYRVKAAVEAAKADAPDGLQIGLSGSAMIGGDMQDSVRESLESTEIMTVILVAVALIVIYRSPLLVLIPLATIGVSLLTAYSVVALCAQYLGPDTFEWGGFKVFTTTKIFVVVILFGAGTDFCLFLIARFKEELGEGVPLKIASGRALVNVGDALAASAFTTILGLATMAFADYGKFAYSGPIVALCLFIALIACVTFAPALLRLLGKIVFWPFGVDRMTGSDSGGTADSKIWSWVADCVLARPATILFASAWLALPFIVWGLLWVEVSHDFMAELSPERSSVQGTEMIRQYYAPGEVAPTMIVARTKDLDLNAPENNYALAYLHGYLMETEGVVDVRDKYLPAGKHTGGNATTAIVSGSPDAFDKFISDTGEYAGHVTQLQVILDEDPFSRAARTVVDRIESRLADVTSGAAASDPKVDEKIRKGLADWKGTEFELGGTTPGIRDLETVTISDQTRIQVCVVIAVFAVILVILRDFLACLYLIITVLLSYFATIGLTDMFFTWLYGDTFDGLDWKVPIFLFVILIAVGQDYNIYLTTRVFEEQKKLGMRAGLRRAVIQTGGIITSCGIIMAGTFISMATGSLRGMIELGFALSVGVLIDTFFVRTVVVPCFFALTARSEEPSLEQPAHDIDEPTTKPTAEQVESLQRRA